VHGEINVQKAFASRLELKGFRDVEIPVQHEEVELNTTTVKAHVA